MEFHNKEFCLEVWGDYACFTRPEMKVERVSYDVPTPSAVRGIFEAIFWKPAFKWKVTRIEVLNPVKWVSVRRNEVGSVMSERSDGIIIEEQRQQRAGLLLKDVRYRFYAELDFIPSWKRVESRFPKPIESEEELADLRKDENPGKYNAMFERRAKKGQCFNQPYLGCREFSCFFKLIENPKNEQGIHPSIDESRDLGFMLFDLFNHDTKGAADPGFYRAKMENGVIHVPDPTSEEVFQ